MTELNCRGTFFSKVVMVVKFAGGEMSRENNTSVNQCKVEGITAFMWEEDFFLKECRNTS